MQCFQTNDYLKLDCPSIPFKFFFKSEMYVCFPWNIRIIMAWFQIWLHYKLMCLFDICETILQKTWGILYGCENTSICVRFAPLMRCTANRGETPSMSVNNARCCRYLSYTHTQSYIWVPQMTWTICTVRHWKYVGSQLYTGNAINHAKATFVCSEIM